MPEPLHPARLRPAAALAAATAMSLPLGSIYAFSVLLAPLEQLLEASRSSLASVFGISAVFFTIGANVVPRLFGRVGAPLLVALTAVLAAAGVAMAAAAPSLPWLVLGYGVLFALGGGMAYVVVQQSVNATPLSRPGLVNGYLVSLFPLGAMIAAPAFGWAIDWVGVRATLGGLAAAVALTGAAATLLVVRSGVVLAKPSARAPTGSAAASHALRATFWKLFTVFFLAAAAGLMVMSQAAGMVVAYGASKPTALLATTGITAAIAAARLVGGLLIDRLQVPYVAASAQAFAALGAAGLTLWPSPETAILALAMIGVGYGLISGVTAGAVASYWPKAEFGRIASKTYVAWCLAALSLPVLAAWLFDLTGGYRTAIVVAGCANLAAVLVALSLPGQRSGRPRETALRGGGAGS